MGYTCRQLHQGIPGQLPPLSLLHLAGNYTECRWCHPDLLIPPPPPEPWPPPPPPPPPALPPICEAVYALDASGFTCWQRIEWLMLTYSMPLLDARHQVGIEYPDT